MLCVLCLHVRERRSEDGTSSRAVVHCAFRVRRKVPNLHCEEVCAMQLYVLTLRFDRMCVSACMIDVFRLCCCPAHVQASLHLQLTVRSRFKRMHLAVMIP